MITSAILSLLNAILGPVFSALPTSTLGFLDWSTYGGAWSAIGGAASHWREVIPVVAFIDLVAVLVTYIIPGALAYKVLNWIYKHIPQIGGFGPGSG